MRKIIAYILLTLMVTQLFSSVGYVAWFKINQKSIADLFCVNKNRPDLQCDGKCFMMKGVHQQEEKQHETKGIVKAEISEVFVESTSLRLTTISFPSKSINPIPFSNSLLSGYSQEQDQPPC